MCSLSLCLSGPHTMHILQTVVWTVPLSFCSTYNTHIADCCVDCHSVFLSHIQHTYCRLLCGLSLCFSGPHIAHILQTVVGLSLCLSDQHTVPILQTAVWIASIFSSTYNSHIAVWTIVWLLYGLPLRSGPYSAHISICCVDSLSLSFWSTYNTHIVDCCVDCPSVFLVHIQYTYCRMVCGLSIWFSDPHIAHIL